ncbi:RTA1-domain-containing protein [Hypoxylon trugodes]|uniref:RTA1-domain-containing protein n=1 Tax=Hypoxylon trugodes TaxID=326681 RepID=UPI00219A20E1|nr:RTA1-domain-containing protein [Hypoxylon trugodes]KAI1393359.1 RTA1-domain-containing protein [Hypoxylon trugodes]
MNTGDGPFGPVVNGTQIVFFEYRPNKAAGLSFVAVFGLATVAHLVYFFWLRAWFFIPFILGGVSEVFGYYGRALASDDPIKVGPFILQNLLLLTATPFLAATVYMSFGRVTRALEAQSYSFISIRWMTKIYVLIDFGCIASQLVGSVLPASGNADAIEKSRIILIAGLVTQLAALSLFIITIWHVYRRIQRHLPITLIKDPSVYWQNHFRALAIVTLLMIIRSLVRSIEFLQGQGGFVISHEAFIYVFDAAPMALVMIIFLIIHPARLVRDARRLNRSDDDRVMLSSL